MTRLFLTQKNNKPCYIPKAFVNRFGEITAQKNYMYVVGSVLYSWDLASIQSNDVIEEVHALCTDPRDYDKDDVISRFLVSSVVEISIVRKLSECRSKILYTSLNLLLAGQVKIMYGKMSL